MLYVRALALMAILTHLCACTQSSGSDAGPSDAASGGTAEFQELVDLTIAASNAEADASQVMCDCGLTCGHPLRMSEAQATCYLLRANGQHALYRQYFQESMEYFQAIIDCHAERGCAPIMRRECGVAPPELLRTPPDFIVLAAGACFE